MGIFGPIDWPIFGNSLSLIFQTFKDYEEDNFKKYGSTYVDYVWDSNGCIVTSNQDYVKRILVKDFKYFNHRYIINPYLPEYSRKAVIFQNEDWKRIRSQISSVFSSGKLKMMYKNFNGPVNNVINNINELIDSGKSQHVDILKLTRAFSLDIIAHMVFSLKTNTFKEGNSTFIKNVNSLFKPKRLFTFLGINMTIMPKSLIRALKLTTINEHSLEYFSKLTLKLIDERKKSKEDKFNDFIELLLKSQTEENKIEKNYEEDGHLVKKLTTEEIVGQCFIFFAAGLESISAVLSFLLHELAFHSEIQLKLYKELWECHPTDEINYEDINKCEFLDACLNEVLRLHTTVCRVFRTATQDYDFGEFKVQKGQTVGLSLQNLHHDPEVYSDAHTFNPNRFSGGELADASSTYSIPFLDGPRNCIGNRLAIIEMKSVLIPLFKNFRVFGTNKTGILKLRKHVLINSPVSVNLGFERRVRISAN